jgi:hypothetical protein
VTNNPIGKQAIATLPLRPFTPASSLEGNVKGTLSVKSGANGRGVEYTLQLSNLPKSGGPFLYHIHQNKVPDNGNCTATLAHLDPFLRGEVTDCEPTYPKQTCQVGDNSGKYGKITSDPFTATYTDPYGSMVDGSNASIHDRSFVVHFANKTRITCANFVVVNATATTYPTGTARPTSTQSSVVTAAANALSAAGALAAIPMAALFYMM